MKVKKFSKKPSDANSRIGEPVIVYPNESLNKLARLMDSNSLVSNLKKGYSILTIDNKIIKDSNLIKKEDEIKARLNKGTLCLNVKKIN